MSEHKIEFDAQCESCKATGLYVGVCERDGMAVVCHSCKGTGKVHRVITYSDFEGRQQREDVKRVLQVNCGIVAGENKAKQITIEQFGGMTYNDWLAGGRFQLGMEMREFTCPAWFYQSADYKKKPDWDECGFGSFSACASFPTKDRCWERFDAEQST